jgi:hypothetical protein
MDANPLALLARLGRSPYIATQRTEGCRQLIAPSAVTPFNSVCQVAWPQDEVDARAEGVRNLYMAGGFATL